jgi:hypothetical protein
MSPQEWTEDGWSYSIIMKVHHFGVSARCELRSKSWTAIDFECAFDFFNGLATWCKAEMMDFQGTSIATLCSINWLNILEIAGSNLEIRRCSLSLRLFDWFRRIRFFQLRQYLDNPSHSALPIPFSLSNKWISTKTPIRTGRYQRNSRKTISPWRSSIRRQIFLAFLPTWTSSQRPIVVTDG